LRAGSSYSSQASHGDRSARSIGGEILPYKDPEVRKAKQRVYSKRFFEKNRESYLAKAKEQKQKARKEWDAFKSQYVCAHCGISNPVLLDFHHVIKTDKKRIVRLLQNNAVKQAIEEAKTKCIALCSNCHRLVHQQERVRARKGKKHGLDHERKHG